MIFCSTVSPANSGNNLRSLITWRGGEEEGRRRGEGGEKWEEEGRGRGEEEGGRRGGGRGGEEEELEI